MSVLLYLAALASTPAAAAPPSGPLSGGELEDFCLARTHMGPVLCAMFLRGAFEGMMTANVSLTGGDNVICLPSSGITLNEIREMFLDFVHETPDRRQVWAGTLLFDSLQASYPCADAGGDVGPMPSPMEPGRDRPTLMVMARK